VFYISCLISSSSASVGLSTDLQIYAGFEEAIREYRDLHGQYTASMCWSLLEIWIQSRFLVVAWYSSASSARSLKKKEQREKHELNQNLSAMDGRISKLKKILSNSKVMYMDKTPQKIRRWSETFFHHTESCKWKKMAFLYSTLTVYHFSNLNCLDHPPFSFLIFIL